MDEKIASILFEDLPVQRFKKHVLPNKWNIIILIRDYG